MITLNDIGHIVLDIGDKCTHCGRDTGMGSGLWIDRIPANVESATCQNWLQGWEIVHNVDGYLCRECLEED